MIGITLSEETLRVEDRGEHVPQGGRWQVRHVPTGLLCSLVDAGVPLRSVFPTRKRAEEVKATIIWSQDPGFREIDVEMQARHRRTLQSAVTRRAR